MSKTDISDCELIFKKPYSFKRENIYVGTLIKCKRPSFDIRNKEGRELSKKKIKQLGIENTKSLDGEAIRKILFVMDNYNTAKDLLYYSDSYEVIGIKPKIDTNRKLLVTNPLSLNEILTYFDFDEILNENDIRKIYNMFLRNDKGIYLKLVELGLIEACNGPVYYGNNEKLIEMINNLNNLRELNKIPNEYEINECTAKQRIKTIL